MEENSVLHTIIKNFAVNVGFMMAALLMFFGIMDYKKILEEAKSPQRHASATFFVLVEAYTSFASSTPFILSDQLEGVHFRRIKEESNNIFILCFNDHSELKL
ncbi:unnamed protein product [Dovyalis caffra]|uniref:Uncharacterized protein n=1 Tax=Dovyalis caffra TaxID=77055 RepID=A0AAV1SCV7_9ROSI|nr:unnamed protein product [Dovyalis caffra]